MKLHLSIAFVCLCSLLPSWGIMYLSRSGGQPLTLLFGWPAWMGGLFFATHTLFTWDEPYYRSLNNDTIGSPVMMIPFIAGFVIVPFISSRLSKRTKNVKRKSTRR